MVWRWLTLAALIATTAGAAWERPIAAQAAAPDVIVVVTDDMRASDWRALPQTRAFIAERGEFFPNFFTTTPLCCPSRVTVLTGRYAHSHGVLDNKGPRGGWRTFERRGLADETIAVALDAAGYRTALIGKYLNGSPVEGSVPPGWDRWLTTGEPAYTDFWLNDEGERRFYGGKRDYLTDTLAKAAVKEIRRTGPDQPLFLLLAPFAPHGPSTPAPRHADAFAGAGLARGDPALAADRSAKPAFIRATKPPKEDELDRRERARLQSLLAVDEAIAAVLEAQQERGRLDRDTYLFVFSDNGYLLGEHGLVGKRLPYVDAVRVGLAAFGPGFAAGGRARRLVATNDIAPTIAEVAGVRLPAVDGRSLLQDGRRKALLLEVPSEEDQELGPDSEAIVPAWWAVRSKRWLYVEWATNERELYDLKEDPRELSNLLAGGGADGAAEALADRLDELRACAGATCRAAEDAPLRTKR